MKKQISITLILIVLLSPMIALAAGGFEFDPGNRIANTLELTTTNPEETSMNVIRWLLGILGIVSVIFVLYGGFTWMTAAGNEEKLSHAKKILTYSVIGMGIIILAFTLVSTIFSTSANVSGA